MKIIKKSRKVCPFLINDFYYQDTINDFYYQGGCHLNWT